VTIRAIRPEDKAKLVSAFKNLDRESVYTRFFQYVKELTDQDLRRATEIDFDRYCLKTPLSPRERGF
jgi:hypothetical protein